MAFFRTINFSEPLATIIGEGVTLRTPQMTDYAEWAALREGSSRVSQALGADLAGGRSDAKCIPASRQTLCRGPADRSRLRVSDRPQHRWRAGRRIDPRQHPPRRRASRQCRLLDGLAVRAPRPHDRGRARGHPFRLRDAAIASSGGRLYSDQRCLYATPGKHRLCSGGLCPGISVHQWHLAGPSAVCAPGGECANLNDLQRRRVAAAALGWPRFACNE